MGLDSNCARLLVQAARAGARFERVAMLGRSELNVFPDLLRQILGDHAAALPENWRSPDGTTYAEPFFTALGAREVISVDASAYEHASFVHDLNMPIPDVLRGRFDLVFDGGTLEHVFNLPQALKNCMEMLREGGRVVMHTPANNLFGHGFYQFSPELFFRAFSEENGFVVERLIVHVIGPYGRWYAVSDPDQLRERVELITSTPIHMMVQARRNVVKPVFSRWPMQSDYTVMWAKADAAGAAAGTVRKKPSILPDKLALLLRVIRLGIAFKLRMSLGNRRFFKPIPKDGGIGA
jgi:SAM-dependent methyltransferase